jgi:hypothetical protein
MRTQHLGLDPMASEASTEEQDPPARISGTTPAEFPEPTPVELDGLTGVEHRVVER